SEGAQLHSVEILTHHIGFLHVAFVRKLEMFPGYSEACDASLVASSCGSVAPAVLRHSGLSREMTSKPVPVGPIVMVTAAGAALYAVLTNRKNENIEAEEPAVARIDELIV
ncbi:hypothetical protein FOZ63_016455, partial [Perkinsus olseni]